MKEMTEAQPVACLGILCSLAAHSQGHFWPLGKLWSWQCPRTRVRVCLGFGGGRGVESNLHLKFGHLPWPLWCSWLGIILCTERLAVWCPVTCHLLKWTNSRRAREVGISVRSLASLCSESQPWSASPCPSVCTLLSIQAGCSVTYFMINILAIVVPNFMQNGVYIFYFFFYHLLLYGFQEEKKCWFYAVILKSYTLLFIY